MSLASSASSSPASASPPHSLSSSYNGTAIPWRCSWRFPPVAMSSDDEERLLDLALRLNVADSHSILQATQQLQAIVNIDCPAEVFLQIPRSLGALIGLVKSQIGPDVDLAATAALRTLFKALHKSLRFHSDSAFRLQVGSPDPGKISSYPGGVCDPLKIFLASSSAVSATSSARPLHVGFEYDINSLSLAQGAHLAFTACVSLLSSSDKVPILLPLLFELVPFLFIDAEGDLTQEPSKSRRWKAAEIR